jgi:hypothetical protein
MNPKDSSGHTQGADGKASHFKVELQAKRGVSDEHFDSYMAHVSWRMDCRRKAMDPCVHLFCLIAQTHKYMEDIIGIYLYII